MTTYVCDGCGARWKVVASDDTHDESVRCPNCAPAEVVDLEDRRRRRAAELVGEALANPTPVFHGTVAVNAPGLATEAVVSFTITHSSPPGAWLGQWP